MSNTTHLRTVVWLATSMLVLSTGVLPVWAAQPAVTARAEKAKEVAAPPVVETPVVGTPPVVANLFPAQTWQPPPPPPAPPPKPVAPPLPFKFAGSLQDGNGETMAFLSNNNRQIIAKTGDLIDGNYRVDAVSAEQIEFTYLPLQEKQRLLTGTKP